MYTQNILEIYQNYANIFVACFCGYELLAVGRVVMSDIVVATHIVTDLFITEKRDIQIHHYLSIGMFFMAKAMVMRPTTSEEYTRLLSPFLITELSSIPYAIDCLIDLQKVERLYCYRPVLQILFAGLFVYLRIYRLRIDLLLDESYVGLIRDVYHVPGLPLQLLAEFAWGIVYAFIALNLYWAVRIAKRLFRMIPETIPVKYHMYCGLHAYSVAMVFMLPNRGYHYASLIHHVFGMIYIHEDAAFYIPIAMDLLYIAYSAKGSFASAKGSFASAKGSFASARQLEEAVAFLFVMGVSTCIRMNMYWYQYMAITYFALVSRFLHEE